MANDDIWYGSDSVPDPKGATGEGSMKNVCPDAGAPVTIFPEVSVPVDNVKVISPEETSVGISQV